MAEFAEFVKWGILSTAGIAARVSSAIKGTTNGRVVAVASRSLEKATAWALEHHCDDVEAFGTYEELLASGVDAVYIPLPTALHLEWAVKAAEAGKHILLEKPAATTSKELREILAACDAHKVQFMDGVMFMHNERLPVMSAKLHLEKCLGPLRRVNVAFTFLQTDASNIRMDSKLEPLGCLGDLGWYAVRFALWAFEYEMPDSVQATHFMTVPGSGFVEFDGLLHWSDGRVASIETGFTLCKRQCAEVVGVKGRLALNDFCSSNNPEPYEFLVHAGGSGDAERIVVPKLAPQAQHEVQAFADIVLAARASGPSALVPFWGTVALQTQLIIDACAASAAGDGCKVAVLKT